MVAVLEGEYHASDLNNYVQTTNAQVRYRIVALMLGRLRMDVDTTIKHYDIMVTHVFSDLKGRLGDGRFKATKLEAAIKSIVRDVTGNSESPLLERNEFTVCRT